MGNQLVSGIWDNLTAPIQGWLATHPLWNWLIVHPLWLLAAVLLVLFLFSGLLRAIGRLTEWLWLAVLRSPVWLGQWIVKGITLLVVSLLGIKAAQAEQVQQQERLSEILQRLDDLKQEQDQLLQEVKAMLGSHTKNVSER